MRKIIGAFFVVLLVATAIHILPSKAFSEEVFQIEKEKLKNILDNPDVVVIDVRMRVDWSRSEKKILGALRRDPYYVSSWAKKISRFKTLVVYANREDKENIANIRKELKTMGFTNVFELKGGWQEWENAGYPVEQRN